MLDLCIVCELEWGEKGYYFELRDVKSIHNRWLFVHIVTGIQDTKEKSL